MKTSSSLAILTTLFLLTAVTPLTAQQHISGVVRDAETGEPLQFANIWIKNSHKGTTSDRDGRFTLPLDPGTYSVVVSYIGYDSQTRRIRVPGTGELTFVLQQQSIELPAVEITPDDNPALRIIRRAIEAKEKRRERLQNYSLTAHTKLSVRVEGALEGMSADGESASVTIGIGGGGDDEAGSESDMDSDADGAEQDSTRPLPILMETQTEAYWARPDRYKEIVTARKQSAMIPSQANFMISAFFIIDFSADELSFGQGVPVPGPISERGLDSYYYRIAGETVLDSMTIHQIEISPLAESEPLLEGTIYIADGTWALSKVDVRLNAAARPQMFSELEFRQNFRLFDSEFWMPVDVAVDAEIDVPVVNIGVEIEGLSVLQDYRINRQMNEDFFDRTRIKVLKEADERDSSFWAVNQMIPTTEEEKRAYLRADTVKMQLDSVRYAVGFSDILFGGSTGSDDAIVRFPGLISLYRFNRVEGHALDGDVSLSLPESPLRSVFAGAGYGFSDGRLKYRFGGRMQFFSSPSLVIGGARYYERGFIDSDRDPAGELFVTLFNLFAKYDYRDYYYRDGWRLRASYDPFLLFPMTVEYRDDRYFNADKNTDWSVFRRSWDFRGNPAVNEGRIRSLTASISFDNRNFIDNAGEITRFGPRNHTPTFLAGMHEADIAGKSWDILTLGGRLSGDFNFGLIGELSYRLAGDWTADALPTQMLYNLQGSMDWLTWPRRFRTLEFREFGGDRRATARFTWNFRDWLFRATNIPWLEDRGWMLELFASGGWTRMSDDTRALQTVGVTETASIFWESGFSVKNIFSVLQVDLAWRLNHFREGRNFYVGIGLGM